jgi:cytochrome c biogenesis protein CcmG/thiol:disulfide interchange protein DsbE
MKLHRRIVGVVLFLAVAAVACSGPGEAVPQGISEGNRARDFTLETLDGRQVSLSDYKGSAVLINLWATWCDPCRAEVPDIEAAYRAHRDEGFVVLGVNLEEPRETVKPFVEEFGITYPVLLDGRGEVMKAYRGSGLPMSVMVDRDGVIRVRHSGFLSAAQLDKYLAQVLP